MVGQHITEIDVDALAAWLAAGDGGGRLIDVREPHEYAAGHVPGAISVPLATVPDRLDAFAGAGPVHVICQVGARSRRACEFVAVHGVDAINVDGGTGAWVASGRPVVVGDGPW